MENISIRILNGINFTHIKTSKFKTTTISIMFRQPIRKDSVTKNTLLSNVLKRGCNKYRDIDEINIFTEKLYGAVFDSTIIKKGEEQIIQLYLDILKIEDNDTVLEQGLNFLNEIIFNPLLTGDAFKKEYVDLEKENVRNEINARINDKREYAKLRCIELMFKDEPFGIYGDGYINDLDYIDNVELYKHYLEVIEKCNIEIIIIGDFNTENISNQLKEIFSKCDNRTKIINKQVKVENKEIKEIIEKTQIGQAKLCMGFRSEIKPVDTDYYCLLLFNEIFGGSPDSKLFVNVREKESLCYYVNSIIFRFKSAIFVQSGIEAKDFEKTKNLILKQLESIQRSDYSSEDVNRAKKGLISRFQSVKDMPDQIMDYYLVNQMLGDYTSIEKIAENIENVNENDIAEIAKKFTLDTVYLLRGDEDGNN